MADRLQELLQQRALIKEHLAWLESEIAAASGRPIDPASGAFAPRAGPSTPPARVEPREFTGFPTKTPVREPVARTEDTDLLLAKLAAAEKPLPVPSKAGCWIFFGGMILLLVASLLVVIFYFYRG